MCMTDWIALPFKLMQVRIHLTIIIAAAILFSCKKERMPIPTVPQVTQVKKILLKDITIPNLPSPYYHFEYRADSTVAKASFASDFTRYDVFYTGNRITEMRSNILVNHDTLRYLYDDMGKIAMIRFINDAGVSYRHVFFNYQGQQVKEITWDHKEGNIGFLIDRTMTLTYFPDGNVKEITDRRPATGGAPETTVVTQFDLYDDKVNVDDFELLHDSFHDHLFLLSNLRIQKNNPRREVLLASGFNYIAAYTYNYNSDGTPVTKTGDVLFTKGPQDGQVFHTHVNYSYY
jgi:hypothetical protein